MAVRAEDAIAAARALLGTPYAQLDCINLIKKVIRTAPGGRAGYTTAGTNSLWRSYDAAAKYRDLTWRQEGLTGAKAGMIAFKASGEDFHHAGIVTKAGTVIHSSSTQGGRGVVETPLTAREGWTHLSMHRDIEVEEKAEEEEAMGEKAWVRTDGGKLNVREAPGGKVIGRIENASEVEIIGDEGEWLRIRAGDAISGYVSAAYISRTRTGEKKLRVIDEAGNIYDMEGSFTVSTVPEGTD